MILRVLASTTHYRLNPTLGSEYQWAFEIVNGVAAQGSEVTAITGSFKKQAYIASDRLSVRSVWSRDHQLDHRRRLEFAFRTWRLAADVMKHGKFDVLHHVLPFAFGRTFNLLALSEARNLPFVLGPVQPPLKVDLSDEVGVSSREFGAVRGGPSLLDRTLEYAGYVPRHLSDRTVRRADVVVAVSEEAKQLCLAIDPAAEVVVVPPGVDTAIFRPSITSVTSTDILVSGFLTRRKQVDIALRAFALLDPMVYSSRLRIVGDGPERTTLVRLAADLGVSNRVYFEGAVSGAEMPKYYQQAAVVCFLSKDETVGMAAIEAMACGVPLIATATGIIPTLLESANGGTIVDADPQAVAVALRRLLDDNELQIRQGRAARSLITTHYDWQQIAKTYTAVYLEAINRRQGVSKSEMKRTS